MNEITLFGSRLRALRKARGLTQQELGEKAGVSYKFLGSTERGQENPSLKFILKLAKALKVEPRDLFEFEHEVTSKAKLRRKLDAMLKGAEVEELQRALRVLRALST